MMAFQIFCFEILFEFFLEQGGAKTQLITRPARYLWSVTLSFWKDFERKVQTRREVGEFHPTTQRIQNSWSSWAEACSTPPRNLSRLQLGRWSCHMFFPAEVKSVHNKQQRKRNFHKRHQIACRPICVCVCATRFRMGPQLMQNVELCTFRFNGFFM